MPQLEISTYASQIFWLVVTFVPLYFFIVKGAIPKIGEVLEARQGKIDDDLKIAATRREEAEAVLVEYQKLQADAHAGAHAAIRQAQEEMKARAAEQGAEVAAAMAKQTAEAEARIAEAQRAALANLDDTVAEAVAAATEKLIGIRPNGEQIKAALAESGGAESGGSGG